jgi:predicted metal-dependent HD superfamily phosphohydrolase
MLQPVFFDLSKKYSNDNKLIGSVWKEIEKNHSHPGRYYHSLKHLENLMEQLTHVKENINSWDGVLFALYFHDVIYNVLKNKNEEKSSEFAGSKLTALNVPVDIIRKCRRIIVATKKHELNTDQDVNYFTDADLSILGATPDIYQNYCEQIRKEYSIYPDLVYKPGRKKVVEHFLGMERIFKTEYFFNKFEKQARINLQQELNFLDLL